MAGEVGPKALLALAKVVMVVTTMVGMLGVEAGLSPPDSSRDGTDFRHFPATTDEKGEQLKLFSFSYFHFLLLTHMTQEGIHGSENCHGLHLSQTGACCSFLGKWSLCWRLSASSSHYQETLDNSQKTYNNF